MKKPLLALLGAGLVFAALTVSDPAQARIRAGVLNCHVAPGVSFILGSRKTMDCVFNSARGYRERYTGRITRIGLDVGFTTGGRLAWAVYAPARRGRGALAGGGVGANVLIGGFRRSITLQPISVGAQRGFDLAVAVSGLDLEFVR